jgi:deoxyadenosine/deoxycytidine kinase|uniref:Deoxynucleoside kinase domain-containing protein n=1 Tax=viral metagenome TaxID=1070528 RepID=A0A6C0JPD1_9ZZZZ
MSLITIDGNIGCGKTSVLNYLHKFYKYPVDLEPVEEWQPYLDKMYQNKENTFNFQIRIWLDRCWIQNKNDNNTIIVERSPLFIKKVFIELALKQNLITEDEFNILINLHNKTNALWDNNIYIYLRSNPDSCINRIKKRNRKSEDNISLDYLQKIDEFSENIIKTINNIIIIDVEGKTVQKIASEINEQIKICENK